MVCAKMAVGLVTSCRGVRTCDRSDLKIVGALALCEADLPMLFTSKRSAA
jgi:hypothetical protein